MTTRQWECGGCGTGMTVAESADAATLRTFDMTTTRHILECAHRDRVVALPTDGPGLYLTAANILQNQLVGLDVESTRLVGELLQQFAEWKFPRPIVFLGMSVAGYRLARAIAAHHYDLDRHTKWV